MKGKGQVALAVGAGYLLGRRRKMRLALMLGTAAATGGLGGLGGQLLRRGVTLAGSDRVLGKVSPELAGIGQMVRGDLLDAGKAAGTALVRSRVDRLSDKIHDQAELWRQGQGQDAEAGADDEAAEEPVDTAEEPEAEDAYDEAEDTGDEAEDTRDEAEDYEDTDEPDDAEDDYSEPEDGEGEPQESEDQPARSGANGESRRRRPERAAPPVRRTRR